MESSDDDGARMSVVARGDHLGGDAACRVPRDSGKFIPTLMVAKRLTANIQVSLAKGGVMLSLNQTPSRNQHLDNTTRNHSNVGLDHPSSCCAGVAFGPVLLHEPF